MNLYDLTLDAEAKVATYRSVNIDEWIEAIDPILKAAGQCTIDRDKVDDITMSSSSLKIQTSYSVRCCAQTNDISIPMSILTADDPIRAATLYRLYNELTEAKQRMSAAQYELSKYTEKVALLEAEISSTV